MAEAAKFSLEYQQQSLLTQAAPPTDVHTTKHRSDRLWCKETCEVRHKHGDDWGPRTVPPLLPSQASTQRNQVTNTMSGEKQPDGCQLRQTQEQRALFPDPR